MAKLLEQGKEVLTPFGDNSRFDLVTHEGGEFTRIQCKTGKLRGNTIRFNTSSHNPNSANERSYENDADFFAVYCPQNKKAYMFPVKEAGRRGCWLRLVNYKGERSTHKRVHWAEDYEI